MLESGFPQTSEALEAVGMHGRARLYVLLQKCDQGGALEIRYDFHPSTPTRPSPFLNRHQDQRGFPALQLSASAQARLRSANPSSTSTSPRSGSRATLTIARRNLCSIIHAVS